MPKSLILIEHDGASCKRSSLSGITMARGMGADYDLLVIGSDVGAIAESVACYGAQKVIVADDPCLAEPLADKYAALIVEVADSCLADTIIGTTSTFAKDVLPRVAAQRDAPMLTNVTAVDTAGEDPVFTYPVEAGTMFASVRLGGNSRVITVMSTSMSPPLAQETASDLEMIVVKSEELPQGIRFVSREISTSSRPDLTEARVVVGGGRPLKDQETFENLIGGLADALGGAVGATRAAVDGGMVSNDCQIGQTGKMVAPELYFAIGVSGAMQHWAGIKDARIIVAINRDPDAPIFQTSTYGLVGDLYDLVPRLIELVGRG